MQGQTRWTSSWRHHALVILALGIVLVMLTGCELRPAKTPRISKDWSPALRVGSASQHEPAAIAVEEDGSAVHLVWPEAGRAGLAMHYLQLRNSRQPAVDQLIELGLFFPKNYRLFRGKGDALHVFFLAAESAQGNTRLYHAVLDTTGRLTGRPAPISPPTHQVAHYDLAPDGAGGFLAVWEAGGTPAGIYLQLLDDSGAPTGDFHLLVADGKEPALAIEPAAGAHLAWITETRPQERLLYYAWLEYPFAGAPQAVELTRLYGGIGAIFTTPRLGFDDGHVYVYWSMEYRAGMEQGSARTSFIAFPKGRPSAQQPRTLFLPDTEVLPYTALNAQLIQWREAGKIERAGMPAEEAFPDISTVVPLSSEWGGSRFVAYPAPLSLPAELQLVFCSVMTEYRLKDELQPGVAILADGEVLGYQQVARTGNLSWNPSPARDGAGHLYLAWPDTRGQGQYDVYIATTAPALQEAIRRPSQEDIWLGALAFGWGMLAGLTTFLPFLLVILVFPLAVVVGYHIFGSREDLTERGPRIVLLVAGLLYYAGKLLIFSALLSFPPFRELLPEGIHWMLDFGLPALILTLALLALRLYIRRAQPPRLFVGFFVFALTDALLTMMLYGPGFYG
ncbi:MAG: hypothetical protein ACUVWB_03660 [Anaerolineae bacterium]